MHLLAILTTFLLLTLPTSATYHHRCLSSYQLSRLAKDWLKVRSLSPTDPTFSKLLSKTVTIDSTYEDEQISYFIPPGGVSQVGPYAKSRQEYLQSRLAGAAISTTTTPVFTLQADVNGGGGRWSCDSITLRWVSSSKVNLKVPFSTANIGDPVVYKGIDLLIVDVNKGKIKDVYTSADYIREIKQKGFPPS